jgi:hypothetical protein
MGKNDKMSKKSELASIAKKCSPIKSYFATKIPTTSIEAGYPTPNHNHVQAKDPPEVFADDNYLKPLKRNAVFDDCSNSNGKVSDTKTKKANTDGRSDSKAKSTPTIKGLADTLRLRSQCSSIAPCDWEDESKYDHVNIKIWNAWLTFITIQKSRHGH